MNAEREQWGIEDKEEDMKALVCWMEEQTDIVITDGIRRMIYIMEGVNYPVLNIDNTREEIVENADHPKEEQVTKGESLCGSSNRPAGITIKGHSQHKQHSRKAAEKKTGTQ